ncbi:MAG: hypothetical protein A2Z34_03465 [Planctomycetes bacterium RBG_16_59_8]|nr:MAG: hypothetical protein A2Z34_03465 [Planctomycetes bacterium RBG_16_59_8]
MEYGGLYSNRGSISSANETALFRFRQNPLTGTGKDDMTHSMKKPITLAHSPDSDDAFMFYGLAKGKVETGGLRFKHILRDIETLNRAAELGTYDITAISFHAYPYVQNNYRLMTCGSSIGDRYGPMIVAKRRLSRQSLRGKTIAIPGTMTTAYLALRLFLDDFLPKVVPFDRIPDAVRRGEADAGLLIHEGQLTYGKIGLHKIVDLGEWWWQKTRLPLPLGGNAIHRRFADADARRLEQIVKESILHGLAHRDEALRHAMTFSRGMTTRLSDKFVGMYVNDYTVDMGPKVKKAIALLLDLGWREGIIPCRTRPEFVRLSPRKPKKPNSCAVGDGERSSREGKD